MPGADASANGIVEFGALSVMTTVDASGVSNVFMLLTSASRPAPKMPELWRFRLNTTAAASYGRAVGELDVGLAASTSTPTGRRWGSATPPCAARTCRSRCRRSSTSRRARSSSMPPVTPVPTLVKTGSKSRRLAECADGQRAARLRLRPWSTRSGCCPASSVVWLLSPPPSSSPQPVAINATAITSTPTSLKRLLMLSPEVCSIL